MPYSPHAIARAHALQAQAARLLDRAEALTAEARRTIEARLTVLTRLSDDGYDWPDRTRDLARVGEVVGRDPNIERAKAIVSERLAVNRADAFLLLNEMSQRRNRRLHELAHDVVAANVGHTPRRHAGVRRASSRRGG